MNGFTISINLFMLFDFTYSLYLILPRIWHLQTLTSKSKLNFSVSANNAHSPNEKLHLPTWYKGIEAFVHFIYNLT